MDINIAKDILHVNSLRYINYRLSYICMILKVIYFQKIVTIGRRSRRWGSYRHKKALAGRAGGYAASLDIHFSLLAKGKI